MERNYREKLWCNVENWHKAGYTGKGIKIGFIDDPIGNPNAPYIRHPFFTGKNNVSHCDRTTNVCHQIAPDAILYALPNGPFCCGYSLDWIIEEGITLINVSMTGIPFTPDEVTKLTEHGIKIINSAGNEGREGMENSCLVDDRILGVGAVELQDDKPILADYSSWGLGYVDCVGFSHVWMSEDFGYTTRRYDGTSYAAPWISGMLALYEQFLMETEGKVPDVNEMRQFINSNCLDLGDPGVDLKYGHGLFVLPDITTSPEEPEQPKEETGLNCPNGLIVRVYHHGNIKQKLEALGYSVQLDFFDGFDFYVYTVLETTEPVDAVCARNELQDAGYDAKAIIL